ncbi:MAG: ribonuclease HII [Demequinaceae bacterium]|nr:ribonuclease HII [Demequinaceae bacterium]
MDEVGRGALAGPVSVGVVALAPCDAWPDGLADSKRLSQARRERIASELEDYALTWAVGSASSAEVDDRGIVGALRLAGWRALEAVTLAVSIDALLLDGRHDWLTPPPTALLGPESLDPASSHHPVPPGVPPVTTVVKGDGNCVSIAAASVLAKVSRDAVMVEAHDRHPRYGWRQNKGYGTPDHLAALRDFGPTPWHRKSWRLPELGSSAD